METIESLTADFLAQRQIAVTGVSASRSGPALLIYRKLRDSGHAVYPIHPSAEPVDGDPCYAALDSVPRILDGVVIVNRPELCERIVRQCIEIGVPRVWMHSPLGTNPARFARLAAGVTSVSPAAVELCRQHGIRVIPGGCPMMFCKPVDPGHRCMRWFNRMSGAFSLIWLDTQ